MDTTLKGARLAYHIEKLEGQVERVTYEYDQKNGGLKKIVKKEPAGFLVYFPQGHAIRCRNEQELRAIRYQGVPLDIANSPPFASMDGIHDPNSRIGQLMREQDQKKAGRIEQSFAADVKKIVEMRAGKIVLGKVDVDNMEANDVGTTA